MTLFNAVQGDLRGVDAYEKLFNWTKETADQSINEHIHDPLAQDLLRQILVPEGERVSSIAEVLKHPFFSPSSVDAERLLVKNEELQILRQDTVVSKVADEMKGLFRYSNEKYCVAFGGEPTVFPSCIIVLPYDVQWRESLSRPAVTLTPEITSCAERIGNCFLEITKATARLSFWLEMNKKMRGSSGDAFKSQMKVWLKRSRAEACHAIAREIADALGCGANFAFICEEFLAFDTTLSKAKSYMKDPMRAAKKAVSQHTAEIAEMYPTLSLYLIDEARMIPVVDDDEKCYPIRLYPNPALLKNVFLPFMNIAVMRALANDKCEGLASLLGLPPDFSIPDSWRNNIAVHCVGNCIDEFVELQACHFSGLNGLFRCQQNIRSSNIVLHIFSRRNLCDGVT